MTQEEEVSPSRTGGTHRPRPAWKTEPNEPFLPSTPTRTFSQGCIIHGDIVNIVPLSFTRIRVTARSSLDPRLATAIRLAEIDIALVTVAGSFVLAVVSYLLNGWSNRSFERRKTNYHAKLAAFQEMNVAIQGL